MKHETLRFRFTGASPLVMHNGQLANPMNPIAKAMRQITGKRAKTESDHEELARLEFLGGLYMGEDGPCIPGVLIEAGFIEAAKKVRRGNQAKAGLIAEGNFPLAYDGPRTGEDLWKAETFRLTVGVKVQKNRIMRTRPIFHDWACDISVDFFPDQLNRAEVEEMARTMGSVVGLGDWRPKFGRFSAKTLSN